jgi:chromate reductase
MALILSLSGSLREASSNTSLLIAAEQLAPRGLTLERYRDLGWLPHYNPDLEASPPAIVRALRVRIDEAGGLLISCPEYARGIPGSFKNLLDWLVGSPNFHDKPVALFNASPRASEAQKALRLVLETIAARIVDDACLTLDLMTRKLTPAEIVADATLAAQISTALAAFRSAVGRN